MNYVTLLYLLPHSIYTTKRFQMDSKKHNIGLTHANKHLPRLAIIGAGSIGLLFYHLLKSSHRFDPFFIEPRPSHQVCKRKSLAFWDLGLSYHQALVTRPKALLHADALIITTKAFSVASVCAQVKPYLQAKCPVIIAANGLGAVTKAQEKLPKGQPIFAAITAHGAMKKHNCCFHRGVGPTFIGPTMSLNNSYVPKLSFVPSATLINAIAQTLNGQRVLDVSPYLLKKLSANAVINPLTARYQCSNGELLKSSYQNIVENLCSEITPILQALGLNTTKTELLTTVKTIMKATATNFSSMEQDVAYGRLNEVEYILTPLIKVATKNNLPAPLCQQLEKELMCNQTPKT